MKKVLLQSFLNRWICLTLFRELRVIDEGTYFLQVLIDLIDFCSVLLGNVQHCFSVKFFLSLIDCLDNVLTLLHILNVLLSNALDFFVQLLVALLVDACRAYLFNFFQDMIFLVVLNGKVDDLLVEMSAVVRVAVVAKQPGLSDLQ